MLSELRPNFKPTVTIIGAGNIGGKVAELAKSHGWTVYGIKRSLSQLEYFDAIGNFVDMDKFLAESDYVINLLPEKDDTRNVYNIDFFRKMKKDAVFCNVGRGASVKEQDLAMAVANGLIRGAIVDASSGYKFKHRNILYTHHMSSVSPENQKEIARLYMAQLKRFLTHEKLECIVPMKE